jgi:hypothetical protein
MGPEDDTNCRSELCCQIEDVAAAVTGHCQRLENELAATCAELV